MAATGALGLALAPRAEAEPLRAGALEHLVPKAIGPWQYATSDGVIIPPSDDQQGAAYDEVLIRAYNAEQLPEIMLLVAYGSGRHGLSQVHRPEACYPAFGFTMTNRRELALSTNGKRPVPATFYTAKSDERVEQLVYWTRVDDRFPTSWRQQTIDLMLARLRGKAPDGFLLRLSTISNDPARALEAMRAFHHHLFTALAPRARQTIFGEA